MACENHFGMMSVMKCSCQSPEEPTSMGLFI